MGVVSLTFTRPGLRQGGSGTLGGIFTYLWVLLFPQFLPGLASPFVAVKTLSTLLLPTLHFPTAFPTHNTQFSIEGTVGQASALSRAV